MSSIICSTVLDTSTGWRQLAAKNPYVQAHALSVNANGSIYILDHDKAVLKYIGVWDDWNSASFYAAAIDACTAPREGRVHGDLVYAYDANPKDTHCDFNGDCPGTGSSGWFDVENGDAIQAELTVTSSRAR